MTNRRVRIGRRLCATIAVSGMLAASLLVMWDSRTEEVSARSFPRVDAPPAPLILGCGGTIQRTFTGGQDVAVVEEGMTTQSWMGALVKDTSASDAIDVNFQGKLWEQGQGSAYQATNDPLDGALTTSSVNSDSTQLAASTQHEATGGDLRGLATFACGRASMEQWLVGSSGTLGTSTAAVLTNPGPSPVTVTLEAFSGGGPVELGGMGKVVVNSGQTRRIILDAALAEQQRIALRVSTDTAGIVARLQTTALNGYTPMGVSFINPAVEGKELTIAGVLINDSSGESTIRIVNPSSELATVDISTINGEGSKSLPGANGVSLAPNSVLDLNLAGLDEGIVSLRIRSNVKVVAAASMIVTENTGESDIAWASAGAALTSGSVAFGTPQASLAFVAGDSSASVSLRYMDANGKISDPVSLEVSSNTQTTTQAPQGSVAAFYESHTPVSAGVISKTNFGIDWVPFSSSDIEESSLHIAIK